LSSSSFTWRYLALKLYVWTVTKMTMLH
jgi:hypothetical protein